MTSLNHHQALKALVGDPAHLRDALEAADVAPLLMVFIHLGGDPAWLDRVKPFIKGPWSFHEDAPEELKAELREAVVTLLIDYAQSGRAMPVTPPMDLLPKMLDVCTGQHVPPEYYPLVLEEMDLADSDPKTVHWRKVTAGRGAAAFSDIGHRRGFLWHCHGHQAAGSGDPLHHHREE